MSTEPRSFVPSIDQLNDTATWLASLQLDNGMIPWFPGGHCDPWNHVEAVMALGVMGRRDAARAGLQWLADTQRPDGSWHNYYASTGAAPAPRGS